MGTMYCSFSFSTLKIFCNIATLFKY